MNKYEKYHMKEINRCDIQMADYNPRKINETARNKLKRKIKDRDFGLIQPIIINKTTKNVVGGHQRLSILDELYNYPENEYTVQCAEINVLESKEKEINIFLNNTSVMGEWDNNLLIELMKDMPNIDVEIDLGFDTMDINYIYGSEGKTEEAKFLLNDNKIKEKIDYREAMLESRKNYREREKEKNEKGESVLMENNDYVISFVFNNNKEKQEFLEKLGKNKKEKFLKGYILTDIAKGLYKI